MAWRVGGGGGWAGGDGTAAGTGVRRAGGGREEGGNAVRPRLVDLLGESAGESGGGAGESGPLAVFALLLGPAGDGAERYCEVGEGAVLLMEG